MDLRQMTLQEINDIQKQRLEEVIAFAGNIKHLSFMLGLSHNTVMSWVVRGCVSKAGAQMIESHETLGKHFKAEYLRPTIN